ncbi:hypothetical protein ACFV8Z_09385 [Streptomyces sp. NPDC059837]|uniref:hypothetical protein n=1 Tax=Streptomyces sp. NPDC059837 TaxID=3346968 RepID=UPI00365BC169
MTRPLVMLKASGSCWRNSVCSTPAPAANWPPTLPGSIGKRPWPTVFRFPTCTLDLNPAEGVWAYLKKSLGNLAPCSIDDLAGLVRTRLKRTQYRHDLLDGFIAETGQITAPP